MGRLRCVVVRIAVLRRGSRFCGREESRLATMARRLPTSSKISAHEIIALHQEGHSDLEIAQRLCAEGYRSPRHEQVLPSTVRRVRLRHRIFMDRSQPAPHRPGGHWPIAQVAQQLAVTQNWIYARIYSGCIRVTRDEATGLYLFPDHPDTLEQ